MRTTVTALTLLMMCGCRGSMKKECEKTVDHASSLVSQALGSKERLEVCTRQSNEAIQCQLDAQSYAGLHACPRGALAIDSAEPTAERLALCDTLTEHQISLLEEHLEPRRKQIYSECMRIGAKYASCVRAAESAEALDECATKFTNTK